MRFRSYVRNVLCFHALGYLIGVRSGNSIWTNLFNDVITVAGVTLMVHHACERKRAKQQRDIALLNSGRTNTDDYAAWKFAATFAELFLYMLALLGYLLTTALSFRGDDLFSQIAAHMSWIAGLMAFLYFILVMLEDDYRSPITGLDSPNI